jgi:hypothetical protein
MPLEDLHEPLQRGANLPFGDVGDVDVPLERGLDQPALQLLGAGAEPGGVADRVAVLPPVQLSAPNCVTNLRRRSGFPHGPPQWQLAECTHCRVTPRPRRRLRWPENGPVPNRKPTARTASVGVTRTQLAVEEELGWLFREQPTEDYGIDAHVEVVDGRDVRGRLLALQIKSGESWFQDLASGGWWFRPDDDHVQYWLRHSLPVVVILYYRVLVGRHRGDRLGGLGALLHVGDGRADRPRPRGCREPDRGGRSAARAAADDPEHRRRTGRGGPVPEHGRDRSPHGGGHRPDPRSYCVMRMSSTKQRSCRPNAPVEARECLGQAMLRGPRRSHIAMMTRLPSLSRSLRVHRRLFARTRVPAFLHWRGGDRRHTGRPTA